jgi:hypothetical protein
MRARLLRANGSAGNHVMLTKAGGSAVQMMDRWLDAIAADKSSDSPAVKTARNKPADVRDACRTDDDREVTATAKCDKMYPPHGDPRLAAGAPLTNDVLKCALKPLDPTDYKQPLTAEDLDQLKKIFPDGVCDYARPGIEQQPPKGTWLRY